MKHTSLLLSLSRYSGFINLNKSSCNVLVLPLQLLPLLAMATKFTVGFAARVLPEVTPGRNLLNFDCVDSGIFLKTNKNINFFTMQQ